MSSKLQEGIYYGSKPLIGNSFCILSLRAESASSSGEVGRTIREIWAHLTHLKKGITVDMKIDLRHRKVGNLSVLIAYGSKIFELPQSKKTRPSSFSASWNFKPPAPEGGGEIAVGSGISYSQDTHENHLLSDHVLFQFIADSEFYTKRACVEVWKAVSKLEKNTGNSYLRIIGLYSGFQRADKRNWFGFHDGVSNLKSRERPNVISINSRSLSESDKWAINGTFLAFIRIGLDLERWEQTPIAFQEISIGRDKLTGCPLVGVDKNMKPIKVSRCPVPGTSEVIDPGNEYFRDHPVYGISHGGKDLQLSHIGSTSPVDRIPVGDKKSLRIFRQGFEFLDASKDQPGFMTGLNFVSFQNTPERLFKALTYRHMISQKILGSSSIPNLEHFMSVYAGGVFFVPPLVQNEPFPGAQIFFDKRELRNL